MSNFFIPTASRIPAIGDAIVDAVDVGGANATLLLYTGTQPVNPDVAITSQLLVATFALQKPAFSAFIVSVSHDKKAIYSSTLSGTPLTTAAIRGGIVTWFRILDGNGTAAIDGSVGTADADLILDLVTVGNAGVALTLNSLVASQANAPTWGYGYENIPHITQDATGIVI